MAPHAGWTFSGGLAATVFRALPDPGAVDLVIVLGGHLGPGDPVVAMCDGVWDTPFGPLTVHDGFREALESLPAVVFEDARRHFEDNSVEVQLPFVKFRYPDARLLPLRVPPNEDALRLGALLARETAARGIRAVTIASTDLTHYGPAYRFEPQGRGPQALAWVRNENDRTFIDAITGGDNREVLRTAAMRRNACSPGGVAAMMEMAGLAPSARDGFSVLAYATSQDVKPHDGVNFVGYVGGVLTP